MTPRYLGINNVYKTKADNKDIRDLLEKLVPEATKQMKGFANQFKGANQQQTCKNIFDYIKNNFQYVADGDKQIIKLPSALLRKKVGDCKSYSLFTASILSNLGIPYHFVYASYNDNPIPHHVYVETDNGCKIDVVYGKFNQEKKAKYKYKKNMDVQYMAGLGCCNDNRMGKITLINKEKRQAISSGVKKAVTDVKGEIKKDISKAKEKGKEVLQKAKTITPAIAMGRGLFLILVKNNYDGLASKIALNDYSDLLNRWYKLGGNRTALADAIKNGSQKPEKKLGFLPKLKAIIGNQPLEGVGIGKISPALVTAIIGLATAVGTIISPEKTTGAVAGASLGSVVSALLPALSNVLANITPKKDEPLQEVDKENPDDGGGNMPSANKYLPYILGAVVLGAGVYLATKKK